MAPTVVSTAVLAVQLSIVALLLYGVYRWKRKNDLSAHARFQSVAALLNLLTVLVIMVPSFLRTASAQPELTNQAFILVTVHHALGLVAVVMTLVLAGGWMLRGRKPTSCPGRPPVKRTIMRVTFTVWMLALALGVVVYFVYYIG